MVKGSYQDELDHFFKSIFGFEVAKRIVSKAALAKARMKLKYEAFIEFNAQLVSYFYENFKPLQWNGFNLLNKITVDAIIESKDIGERELAAFHFLNLMPNDLILLDKGYLAIRISKLSQTVQRNGIGSQAPEIKIDPGRIGHR